MKRLQVLEPETPRSPASVALVSLTTFCNAKCGFCCVLDTLNRPELNPPDDRIFASIDSARADGATTLSFTGGEPTLHPRFAELCSYGRSIGYEHITINTNGIKFKSRAFTEEVVEAGLSNIDFSIHGHTAELHDAMVARPGAFEAIVKGMGHLRELGPSRGVVLGATTVVTESNGPVLGEIASCLIDLGFTSLRFKHGFEGAVGSRAELVTRYEAVIPSLRAAVALSLARGAGVLVTHFPLCLLGPDAVFASDLLDENVRSFHHSGETLFDGRASTFRRSKTGACDRCVLSDTCTRVDERYEHLHGEEVLKPVESPAALTKFFTDALDVHALGETQIERLQSHLSRVGAPPLIVSAPALARRRHGTHTVLLAGGCDRACTVCDCHASPTALDPDGVPAGVRAGGGELVLRGESAGSSAFGATMEAVRTHGWSTVWLRTSGARFVEEASAGDVKRAGVTGVIVPLFSHAPGVHDKIAQRPEAMVTALRAMRACDRAGLQVSVEAPVLTTRLQDLAALTETAVRAVPGLNAVRFYGLSDKQPAALAPPSWDEARPVLARAIDVAEKHRVRVRLTRRDGIPRCALPERIAHEVFGTVGAERPAREPVTSPCGRCAAFGACPGPTDAYIAVHGDTGLIPVVHARVEVEDATLPA